MRSPGLVNPKDGLLRIEDVLRREGISWDDLEKVVFWEVGMQMSKLGMHLDDARLDELRDWMLEKAVIAARKFDVEEGARLGIAFFPTYLVRMIPYGVIDWLRATRGDMRRGRPLEVSLTIEGDLPEVASADWQSLDALVDEVSGQLSPEAKWALEHLGRPVFQGAPLREAARAAGVELSEARERWRILAEELAA